MDNGKFYIGNYKEDAEKHSASGGGWFIGHFIENGLRKSNDIEVKHWEFPSGKANHETKIQCCATEITIVLRGKIDGIVDNGRIMLEAGQYIIIHPKVINGFPDNVLEEAEGLTIKIPSLPGDKITKKVFENSKN